MNTDHAYIEKLLNRFFDGQSTLDEEAELEAFFAGNDVPAEWLRYKKVFQYIGSLQPAEPAPRISIGRSRPLRWAAAAAIAIVMAIALKLLFTAPEASAPQPVVSQRKTVTTLPAVDTATVVATTQQATVKPAASMLARTKTRHKPRYTAKSTAANSADSAEIIHTEAELEKAEQEYIADRLLLEHELRQSLPPATQRSGWVTTSLNIQ